jgi:hypothetical protein
MGAGTISNTYLGSLSKMTKYRTNPKCCRVVQGAMARTALATILPISVQPLKLIDDNLIYLGKGYLMLLTCRP